MLKRTDSTYVETGNFWVTTRGADHGPVSHTAKAKSCVHRPDFVHVTTRTSQDDGFIKIGAGFIVHGFSLFPARRFLIMHFRAGYSSIGEPQKITMYSPGRRRQFYNFIVSNGTFLILVKLSGTYYEPWYLFRSYEKTYSKCSSLLLSSEPNSAYQKPSGETLEERLQLSETG